MIKGKENSFVHDITVLVLIIFSSLLFFGCNDHNLTYHPTNEIQPQINSDRLDNLEPDTNGTSFIQQANKHFIQLAEEIPEFGGIYLKDKGATIVVMLTQMEKVNKQDIKQNVQNYLSREAPVIAGSIKGGVDAMDITLEKTTYRYTQLREWKNTINEPVLKTEGVTFTSLSQKENKIHVGIKNENIKNEINTIINKHEVPTEAMKISVTGPIRADVGIGISNAPNMQPQTTLRDMYRPLVGGLQIDGYNDSGIRFSRCTYSFNATRRSGGRYWLTNSHCTGETFSVNPSDEYYQSNDNDGASAYIGSEIQDPGPLNVCYPLTCRFSDAALLELPNNQTWNFGEIARTEYSAGPGEGAGSIVIDANNPRFIIVDEAEEADYFEGLWLSKVGRSTGWTDGEITETCAAINNYPNNGNVLLCQVLTTYYSSGGDSGSPVHASPYGWPDVDLYGINWGRFTEGEQERIFSRITGVQEDLGALRTHDRQRGDFNIDMAQNHVTEQDN